MKLGTATLIAQISNFLLLPLILRIYSPSDYGRYLLVVYGCNLILPFVVLRLDTKMIASSDSNFFNSARLYFFLTEALLIFLAFSILTASVIINSATLKNNFVFVELMLMLAIVQSFVIYSNSVALNRKLVKQVALSSVLQNLVTALSQLVIGLMLRNEYALLFGFILGRLAGLGPTVGTFATFLNVNKSFSFREIMQVGTIIDFRILVSGLIDATTVAFPVFLTYIFISSSNAGALGLAQSLLAAPVTLIGGTLINSILVEKKAITSTSDSNYRKIHVTLITSGAAVAFAELVFAKFNLAIFLGENWIEAKNIFVMLVFPFCIFYSTSSYFGRLFVENKWSEYAIVNLVGLFGGIIFSVAAINFSDNWLYQATGFFMGRSIFLILGIIYMRFLSRGLKENS